MTAQRAGEVTDILIRDYVLLLTQLALDVDCPYRLMAVQKLAGLTAMMEGSAA